MAQLPQGAIIQLERKGFYKVDVAASPDQPMVLFNVPDGHSRAKK